MRALILHSLIFMVGSAPVIQAQVLNSFSWSGRTNQLAGVPFSTTVTARDANYQAIPNFNGVAWLSGWTTSSAPALLLSELDTAQPRIELTNPGDGYQDVSGWEITFYDAVSWPAPRNTFALPAVVVPPGGVFEVRANGAFSGSYPVFFTGSPSSWSTASGGGGPAAVLLRDSQGVIRDFVCAGTAYAPAISTPAALSASDWYGLPLAANGVSTRTYQRVGWSDHDNANDWVVTNRTAGTINAGLNLPFSPRTVEIPITPTSVTFTNGTWAGLVTVQTNDLWIFLRADDRAGHSGQSDYFLTMSGPPLHLQIPSTADEATAGFAGWGTVSLPFSVITNLQISLSSSRPTEISVPLSISMLAGQSSASFGITNYDDALLDGTRTVQITAQVSGFASAAASMHNLDNETAVLTWVTPATVMEGAGLLPGAGQIHASIPPAMPIAVTLTSSHPAKLQVPKQVFIPAGQTVASVDFQVFDNNHIDGAVPVQLQASVPNWTPANTNVTVTDNEATHLTLILPAQVWEGSGELLVAGRVRISGTLQTNLNVALNSTWPAKLSLPESVTLFAGSTSAVFSVAVPNNFTNEGNRSVTVTASAPHFLAATHLVNVLDDDVNQFQVSVTGNSFLAGTNIPLSVQALNRDHQLIQPFNGFATLAASNAAGAITATPAAIGPFTNGFWSGSFQIPVESVGVRVTLSDSGGHQGQSSPFDVIGGILLDLPVADIAFDSVRGKFWAAIKSGAPMGAQSVVQIDPATGAFGPIIPLANQPGKLVVTEDGQFLYASLMSTGGVARINLSANAVDLWFALGAPTTTASQLGVLPGASHRLIAQMAGAHAGTALFENGVRKPDLVGPAGFATEYHFGIYNSPTNFLYFNNGGMLWLNTTPAGLTVVRGASKPSYAGPSVSANGLLFFASGDVVEPRNLNNLGAYATNGLIAVDAPAGQVFFLAGDQLRFFDLATFADRGAMTLPVSPANVFKMIRGGGNRLAIIGTDNKLLLLQTTRIRQPAIADLVLSQTVNPATAIVLSNVTYSITISNAGPAHATNVVFTDVLPADSALIATTSTHGTFVSTNGFLSCDLGVLSNGAVANLQFTIQPAAPGLLRNSGWVTGDGINLSNSISVLETSAVFGPIVPAITRLRINSAALAYDALRNVLWTSSTRFADAQNFSLRSINLSNGLPQTAIPLGYHSEQIALSANRTYLYAAYANDQDELNYTPDNYLARANLTANTIDQTIPVVDMFNQQHAVVDLIGITSFPSAVLVARAGPQNDIALYQNGTVIRRSPTDVGPGILEANSNLPTRFYRLAGGYGGGNVARFEIGASDITPLSNANVFSIPPSPDGPSANDLRYASDRLFSDIGLVANAEALVRTNPIPAAGLVATDVAAGFVYYLVRDHTNWFLTAYSLSTLAPAWSAPLPPLAGQPADLISCGNGLLAFRTPEDELFILNPANLPHNLQADLKLTQTVNTSATTTNLPATFTTTALNHGSGPALDVVLTNRLPPDAIVSSTLTSQGSATNVGNVITASLGDLPIGATAWLQVIATLNQPGIITNSAGVVSTILDPVSTNNVAAQSVAFNIVPNADLSVSQSILAGQPGLVGNHLTYHLTLSNHGPSTVTDAYLIDTLEPGATVVAAQVSQGSVTWDSAQVTAQFGTISNGATVSLTLTLQPVNAGLFGNSAVVGSSLPDGISANNQTSLSIPVITTNSPQTVTELRLRTSDIVFDPVTQQIRAAILSDVPHLSNCVVQLHPHTGGISHQVNVGEPLGMLALSDNAQFLYVARAATGGVSRVNLATDSVDLTFGVFEPDPPRYSSVGDMQVMPGHPHTLAVSVLQGQGNVGLWLYDDGVPRAQFGPGTIYGGVHPIAFGAASNVLYQTYPFVLRTLNVNSSGVQLGSDTGSLVSGYDTGFEFDSGRIYFQNGRVVDPVSQTVVGQIAASGLVSPDVAQGKIYFVTGTGAGPFNWRMTVRAFNATNWVELWSVPLPIASGYGTRLINLAANGLAIATDAGRIFVVRPPGSPAADLNLQQSFSPALVATGQTFTAILTVQNQGPWTATGVVLTNVLPPGFTLVNAIIPGGSHTVAGGVVTCFFGPIYNGASAAATLQLSASTPGVITNHVSVRGSETDTNLLNNVVASAVTVITPPAIYAPDAFVREGDFIGSLQTPIYLTGVSGSTITVQYQTLDGTALAGQHYNSASGTVSFTPGITNRIIFLSGGIRGNTLVESNRYFFLRLTNAVNASLAQSLIKVTILEDDFYSFTVSDVSLLEGTGGNTTAHFNVRLSRPAPQTVSVAYQTFGLTASANDFQPIAGTLHFPPGLTNLTVPVTVYGDSEFEPDEVFWFDLSNPGNAIISVNTARGTIVNDDSRPPFRLTSVVIEGNLVRLTFETQSGGQYRVERCQHLATNEWTIIADAISGTGDECEVTDDFSSGDETFYRVRRLD